MRFSRCVSAVSFDQPCKKKTCFFLLHRRSTPARHPFFLPKMFCLLSLTGPQLKPSGEPLPSLFSRIRHPPALPCRRQHSTIGRLSLNHRVRDGNGCAPQAHRHRISLSYLNNSTVKQPLLDFLRKEVIQPHLPIRLPCYDFTPVTDPAFGRSFLTVRSRTSGVTDSHGVTGGVYKTRERIHRNMLIYDY